MYERLVRSLNKITKARTSMHRPSPYGEEPRLLRVVSGVHERNSFEHCVCIATYGPSGWFLKK